MAAAAKIDVRVVFIVLLSALSVFLAYRLYVAGGKDSKSEAPIIRQTMFGVDSRLQEQSSNNPDDLLRLVAINQRTRGAIGPWHDIGILYSESEDDDTVFNLSARSIDRGRFKYEYRITNNETGVTIELFGGEEVDELADGDTTTIPGYEGKGTFVVLLNSRDELKYIPYF
jgi:hypothetical protein